MSHGFAFYERKVCTKQLYTKYLITEIDRDESDSCADPAGMGIRMKTELSVETTNSLAENIRLSYRRLLDSSRPT